MSTETCTNIFVRDRFYRAVGDRIREARKAAGYTEADLAKRAKLAHSTINNAETGSTCSLLVFVLIAEALDLSLDELVPTEATS